MLNNGEKEFKVMDWLRATRDSIYEETKNMTRQEINEYFQKAVNRLKKPISTSQPTKQGEN